MSEFIVVGEATLSADDLMSMKFSKPRKIIDSTGCENFTGSLFWTEDNRTRRMRYYSDFYFEETPPIGTMVLLKQNPLTKEDICVFKK